ncbi:MAG TPA: T9SS type A sorting domain-containing protein, partial [Bacteroidia bacterium]|nr:T9SS type A sorting domain-containing protein [Bacteroidia bacterium]
DSTVTTNLTVLPVIVSSQALSVCNGGSVTVGTHTYTTSGIFTDTLSAVNGCDSVITTDLIVLNAIVNNLSAFICDNDSIYVGGSWQTASGIYHDTLVSAGGCDSVVVTTLTVNPGFVTSQSVTICPHDSILLGGSWQHLAGIYYDTLHSQIGCDSVLVTTLSVNNVDTSLTVHSDTLVANAAGTTFQWIDCSTGAFIAGATDAVFVPSVSGTYAVIITENGCSDTSSCYSVIIDGISGPGTDNMFTVYPNPVKDVLMISMTGDYKSEVHCRIFNVIGEQVLDGTYQNAPVITLDLQSFADGTYFVEISSENKTSVVKVIKN